MSLPHTYAPSWASTNLTLTPVVFLDQTNVALNSSGLTITWKRKDGSGAETALNSNEKVTGGILKVNSNVLAASSTGMITYICYISYYDSETKNTVNITSDITYTLVRNAENAKLAYVTADTYVFKYNASSALVGASQATLTAQIQGVSISKWQYKNSSGAWADYPTTSDNTSITGGTLVVKPVHTVFVDNVAQIKLLTDDADVYDTISITKMYDGDKKALRGLRVQQEPADFLSFSVMRPRPLRAPLLVQQLRPLISRFRLPDMLASHRLPVPAPLEHCLLV